MTNLSTKILEMYDLEVLTPEVGKCVVRNELYSGLEKALKRVIPAKVFAAPNVDKESIYNEIMGIYDAEILTPELGKCRVKEALSDGLGRTINMIIPSEVSGVDNKILNKEIDYNTDELGNGRQHIKNAFERANIITYGDLIKHVNKCVSDSKSRGYELHKKKNWGGLRGTFTIVRDTICLKGLNSSLKYLYAHLDSLGINLLPGGYRDEEIGYFTSRGYRRI